MSGYTEVEVARLRAEGVVSYERAAELASEFGRSHRSVISKVKQLGLDYVPKAKAPSNSLPKLRKADLVAELSESLGVDLEGLEGATYRSLEALANRVMR